MLLRFKIKFHKNGLARTFCSWRVFVSTNADTRRRVCLIYVRRRRAALADALATWRVKFGGAAAELSGMLGQWQQHCAVLEAELEILREKRRAQLDREVGSQGQHAAAAEARGGWRA